MLNPLYFEIQGLYTDSIIKTEMIGGIMDISKLDLFFAAANSENFTQAAEKCNVAQTTMSKYISQLEEELGVKLFYRTTRECFLTEAGHTFYNGAKELRRDYESLTKQIQNVTDNELKIGLYGEFFDLSVLRDFRDLHPEIELRVVFDDKDTLYEQLRRRKIHAILIPDILVPAEYSNPSFRTIDILSGDAFLFCSKAALENYGSIENVITELPYITKASEKDYHEYCTNILREHFGTSFRDVTRVGSRAKQQLLIELSQGFGIMLKSEAEFDDQMISFPLKDVFHETLQLYYSIKHVPANLRAFIVYIQTISLAD